MRGIIRSVVVERPRLLDPCLTARVVLVEAAGGYGKSVLCEQIAAAAPGVSVRVVLAEGADASAVVELLGHALRRQGLTDLASAADPTDAARTIDNLLLRLSGRAMPLVLVVDELQRCTSAASAWLADLACALPQGAQLLLAGRRVGATLAALPTDVLRLGADDLAFDRTESRAYLAARLGRSPTAQVLDRVEALTAGWPAAVALAAGRLSVGSLPELGSAADGVLMMLIGSLMADADPVTLALCGQLARLPLLSAKVAATVGGPGAMDRMLDLGVPLHFQADGWARLSDPVRDALHGLGDLTRDSAVAAAAWYAANGELPAACLLLRREADSEDLADLLAAQSRTHLGQLGLPLLHALLESLPDDVASQHPMLLRTAVILGEQLGFEHRRSWLARADQLAPDTGPERRAIDAERALQLARDGSLSDAASLATAVLSAAGAGEVLTRARAHFSRGLAVLVQSNAHEVSAVRADLDAAIGLLQLAGESQLESYVHVVLGFGVHYEHGANQAATESLGKALSLLSAPDVARGMCLTYVAETACSAGDLDGAEAALREAEAIGTRLGAEDLLGYQAWSTAELACLRRDPSAALAALENAERHTGTWFERYAGIAFLGQAAQVCFVLDEVPRGLVYLQRAEARVTADGDDLAYAPAARLRYEAMYGDPDAVPALVTRLGKIGLPKEGWLVELLAAVAAARRGERVAAAALLTRARAAAASYGDPDRPERREPELLRLLGETVHAAPSTSVVLLGQFAVREDTADRTPAAGRPATLVKLLALRRNVTVDEAVDTLWPDVALETGRARLRNLLHRVRVSSGEIIIRREDSLVLAGNVSVDATQFELLAQTAISAPAAQRAGLARTALSVHTGVLLPGDPYADWVAASRERLQRQWLSLLDIIAADSQQRGDLDEAIGVLGQAIDAEPLGIERHVLLARCLVRQGRSSAAQAVAHRALAMAEELDVAPEPELLALTNLPGA